jgi:hypothetical protein
MFAGEEMYGLIKNLFKAEDPLGIFPSGKLSVSVDYVLTRL